MKIKYSRRHVVIGFTSIILGFFSVLQWRSFGNLQAQHRDVNRNVFREIQIHKQTNENLASEVEDLKKTLDETSNQALALKSIEEEIRKYQILSGDANIAGPGIVVTISSDVEPIWLIDLVNELFNGGAEAISVNNLRVTDTTQGFEVLPQGQVFFHINTLEKPYIFRAIGDPSELNNIIVQKGGIQERLKSKYESLKMEVKTQETIEMSKM